MNSEEENVLLPGEFIRWKQIMDAECDPSARASITSLFVRYHAQNAKELPAYSSEVFDRMWLNKEDPRS